MKDYSFVFKPLLLIVGEILPSFPWRWNDRRCYNLLSKLNIQMSWCWESTLMIINQSCKKESETDRKCCRKDNVFAYKICGRRRLSSWRRSIKLFSMFVQLLLVFSLQLLQPVLHALRLGRVHQRKYEGRVGLVRALFPGEVVHLGATAAASGGLFVGVLVEQLEEEDEDGQEGEGRRQQRIVVEEHDARVGARVLPLPVEIVVDSEIKISIKLPNTKHVFIPSISYGHHDNENS